METKSLNTQLRNQILYCSHLPLRQAKITIQFSNSDKLFDSFDDVARWDGGLENFIIDKKINSVGDNNCVIVSAWLNMN